MNKIIARALVFASLLFPVGFVLAENVTIPNPLKYGDFNSLLVRGIIPAVAGVVGAVATVMIIVAGIFYLTSAGNPQRMETGKKALIYAIIGIVIAVAAESIALIIQQTLGVKQI